MIISKYCIWSVIFLFLSQAVFAAEMIISPASIIDGDTIEIEGQQIDLYGIDAPEKEQPCRNPNGDSWPCGEHAASALAKKVGTQKLECLIKERNQSRGIIAKCYQKDGNLSHWMLKEGWAVASLQDGTNYVPRITKARAQNKNIWSGEFIFPDDWRAGKRLPQQNKTTEQSNDTKKPSKSEAERDQVVNKSDFQPGALGLSRESWESAHGNPDEPSRTCPASVYSCYENQKYKIMYLSDIVWILEIHREHEGVSVQQSRNASKKLIPSDSRLMKTYRSHQGHVVDLYNSSFLKSKYTSDYLKLKKLVPDQLWMEEIQVILSQYMPMVIK